jgi:hypothetical protein
MYKSLQHLEGFFCIKKALTQSVCAPTFAMEKDDFIINYRIILSIIQNLMFMLKIIILLRKIEM